MRVFSHFSILIALSCFAPALAKADHIGTPPDGRPGIAGTITRPLDPFDPGNKATFEDRFYIDTEFASGPDAPTIFFLGNEGDLYSLIDSAGFMMVMAKKLGANFVALEHRYYGRSIPSQFTELTAENFQYLKIKNALSDYRAFEHFVKKKYRKLRGKWFTIGRSYGASLSVWYRETYPKETVGAVAAAPGINIPKESSLWDSYIVNLLGAECVHDFHAKVLDAFEAPYLQGQSMAAIKSEFGATDISDDGDFLGAIGGASTFLVQMKGPEALCPLLSLSDPATAFIQAINDLDQSEGMTLSSWTNQGITDPRASQYEGPIGMRQWEYQTCVEFGDGEVIPTDPTQTIEPTSIAKIATQEASCMEVLGIHYTADPENTIDAEYYKPLIAADSKVRNVLITADTADPTTALSVPEGQNLNPGLIVYPVQGAAHHQELSTPTATDPQPLNDAREMILNTVRTWLK